MNWVAAATPEDKDPPAEEVVVEDVLLFVGLAVDVELVAVGRFAQFEEASA